MAITEPPSLDPDPDEQAQQQAETSRRERAKMESDNRELTLSNLMLRAGLDPDAGTGQLFFNGYRGDLTKEAIVEAAMAAGILQSNEPPPPPDPGVTPEERGSTGERQQAAVGSQPDAGVANQDEDPRVQAIKDGEMVMANGGTQDAAMAAAFDTIASAAYNDKDPRAIWVPGKEDPRRPDLGW